MTKESKRNLNRLPPKIRLSCVKHGCRLRFVKKYNGYICTNEYEGSYCSVVRVLNLQ